MESRVVTQLEKLIVSLYDSRSGVFSPPVFSDTVESAKRDFSMLFLDAKSVYALAPGDFSLYCVGNYGFVLGEDSVASKCVWPTATGKPELICSGIEADELAKAMIARRSDGK